MMRVRLLPVLLGVLLGVSASCPAAAEPATAPSAKPAKDPDEKLCRREEETGSRLGGRKVCMTRAQWEEQDRAAQAEIDRMRMKGCDRRNAC